MKRWIVPVTTVALVFGALISVQFRTQTDALASGSYPVFVITGSDGSEQHIGNATAPLVKIVQPLEHAGAGKNHIERPFNVAADCMNIAHYERGGCQLHLPGQVPGGGNRHWRKIQSHNLRAQSSKAQRVQPEVAHEVEHAFPGHVTDQAGLVCGQRGFARQESGEVVVSTADMPGRYLIPPFTICVAHWIKCLRLGRTIQSEMIWQELEDEGRDLQQ